MNNEVFDLGIKGNCELQSGGSKLYRPYNQLTK